MPSDGGVPAQGQGPVAPEVSIEPLREQREQRRRRGRLPRAVPPHVRTTIPLLCENSHTRTHAALTPAVSRARTPSLTQIHTHTHAHTTIITNPPSQHPPNQPKYAQLHSSLPPFHATRLEPIIKTAAGGHHGNILHDLDLQEDDWRHFLSVAVTRHYKKGDYIVQEGQAPFTIVYWYVLYYTIMLNHRDSPLRASPTSQPSEIDPQASAT